MQQLWAGETLVRGVGLTPARWSSSGSTPPATAPSCSARAPVAPASPSTRTARAAMIGVVNLVRHN